MPTIHAHLSQLGFSKTFPVEGRESIADLFRRKARTGIYVLHFANDEYYVGQALDVTRRFVQHRTRHADIDGISFKRVALGQLNEAEREAIWYFEEHQVRLRNITLMSVAVGETDFDLIISPAQQDQWMNDLAYVDVSGSRPVDPDLQHRYASRFARYEGLPEAPEVTRVLKRYVEQAIVSPKRTEISFWCCSCLPAYRTGVTIYSRININWQEVFTASDYSGAPTYSFHLARSPLQEQFGDDLSRLPIRFPFVNTTDHFYEPGGEDQVNLVADSSAGALQLLEEPAVIRAARAFNLRLARKGACAYNRYHCMDLATKLLET